MKLQKVIRRNYKRFYYDEMYSEMEYLHKFDGIDPVTNKYELHEWLTEIVNDKIITFDTDEDALQYIKVNNVKSDFHFFIDTIII